MTKHQKIDHSHRGVSGDVLVNSFVGSAAQYDDEGSDEAPTKPKRQRATWDCCSPSVFMT